MHSSRSAFTLIELLVVIAIIAILAVVVVVTLNPAELLRQARDSNRLADLATLTSALNMYATDQGGASGYSLGLASSTYLSIPDPSAATTAGNDCSGIGFPAGGAFHCPASSTYKNAGTTGWIPVNLSNISSGSPISNLPVDPTNTTSSNLYYTYQTDGNTFKLRAIPESQKYLAQAAAGQTSFTVGSNLALGGGPGWVLVPGNGTFGTQNFYVMKYDAVCSDGKGNYLNDTTGSSDTTNYHVYANNNIACTGAGRQIASLPGGYPIADIAETTAKQYCQAIGAHLLTNDEYMTIAINAAAQGANWNGGMVGTSYMYSGHNDNAPAWALPADPNDANGYAGDTNQGGTQKRTYTLSNSSVIWDMAGNVWQEVQRSVMNQGDLTTTINVPPCSGGGASWGWCQFPSITSWTTDVTQANNAPPNSTWSSTQGMGQVYTWLNGGTSQGTNAFIRSGTWSYGSAAGPFTLYLNWNAGNTNGGVGFRCAR